MIKTLKKQIIFFSNALSNSHFSIKFSSSKKKEKSKYSDNYELSQEEIDIILKRKTIESINTEYKSYNPTPKNNYNIPIDDQLQSLVHKQKALAAEKLINDENNSHTIIEKNENKDLSKKLSQSEYDISTETKYGLPIINVEQKFDVPDFQLQHEKLPETTPNIKMWDYLKINEETPYDVYELELKQKFNNELDLYGSETNEVDIRNGQLAILGEEVLPLAKLKNEKYLDFLRNTFVINISIPGTLENEHPHKFLNNLRPLEDFRDTPLIPISEKLIKLHQEKVEKYHRKGVFLEVKKESLLNLAMFMIALYLLSLMMRFVISKEEEAGIAYQRLKLKRIEEY